ncbi:MAG: hypothetical protein ABSB32_22945 [Thermodesulfobacteriota bacterium]|jgi:hypothetical protein
MEGATVSNLEECFMADQRLIMTTHEDLVEKVEDILKTDLGFLYKLAPRELGILATSLEDLVHEGKKRRKSIDLYLKDGT